MWNTCRPCCCSCRSVAAARSTESCLSAQIVTWLGFGVGSGSGLGFGLGLGLGVYRLSARMVTGIIRCIGLKCRMSEGCMHCCTSASRTCSRRASPLQHLSIAGGGRVHTPLGLAQEAQQAHLAVHLRVPRRRSGVGQVLREHRLQLDEGRLLLCRLGERECTLPAQTLIELVRPDLASPDLVGAELYRLDLVRPCLVDLARPGFVDLVLASSWKPSAHGPPGCGPPEPILGFRRGSAEGGWCRAHRYVAAW
eukprot:scaffold57688_cov59-Phaeocystis_antarctica.AAC.6